MKGGFFLLQVQLLCVGKLKESFYLAACREYQKRMGAHAKLQILELPEERLPDSPSPALIEAALKREALTIERAQLRAAKLIALCVEGELLSSEALSRKTEQWMSSGVSALTLVIGGSFGLHDSIKQQAALRLSMSPMTFPHHLARVMLLEQLYRAFQISSGTRYHK